MFRRNAGRMVLLAAALSSLLSAQERRTARIDVEHYTIDAEINPRTQTLTANVSMRFVPQEDATSLQFEYNNALTLPKITDDSGRTLQASRSAENSQIRLSLPDALPKGKPSTLTFSYDGRLTGAEESPVYGIKFAAIQPDHAFLLYPARWFPVNEYTVDRFTADIRLVVPTGFRVIGSGVETSDTAPADKVAYRFKSSTASFPGSIAIVKGDPKPISSGGITTTFYLREAAAMAAPYAEEIGKVMAFLTHLYGLAPKANLTVVETEKGAPEGYSAPGILFLSPRALGTSVRSDLLVNQIARQWWGNMISPSSRNHMWFINGLTRYAELQYLEQSNPGSFETKMRDAYIEALTVEQPPLIQTARLEDYSPEYWAATAGKGAAILNMLRYVTGDEVFLKILKTFPDQFANKAASTNDFRKVAETVFGESLQWFFTEWIESSGAPEFKMEFTVFRTQKGFRVLGKVNQDLDTFRMPVDVKVETEGNPEEKRVEVVGTSSEFVVETFGKPKSVILDPKNKVLRFSNDIRVAVAIRRGEQFVEIGEYPDALKEYQKALEVQRNSSLAHYRVGEVFFLQANWQSAANEFRESLSGDLLPKWTEVWGHIQLGKIFDITDQRERAVNEYRQAIRTKDNTQGALEEAGKYVTAPYKRQASTN